MKKILTLALVAFVSLAHDQHKETRKISKVSGISVSSGIKAKFIKSSRNEVVVDVSRADLLPKIETNVKGGTLVVRVKPNSHIQNSGTLNVTVYSNSAINSISLSSAGSLEILEPIDAINFTANLSSAGKLKAGRIAATSATIDLSSSGKMTGELKAEKVSINSSSSGEVTLVGKSKTLNVNMSSSGEVNLENFNTGSLTVNGSSGGKLSVAVSNAITANVSSGAKVVYSGNPSNKNVNHSSGGSVSSR